MEILDKKLFKEHLFNQNDEILVIDFFAAWCGPCQTFAPIFERVAKNFLSKTKNQNTLFYKVDIEKDPEIASEYGIMSIPTILVIKNGKEIKRKIGSMQEIDFMIWLNELSQF